MITKTSRGQLLGWLSAVSVALLVLCCNGSTLEPSTDGETHFLKVCTPDSDSCGAGLTCTCGVCSSLCAGAQDCSGLHPAAECVSTVERLSGSCETPAEAICDVPCATDSDCGPVSSGLECSSGFCRGTPTACTTGEVSGAEVVVLGDVFVAQSPAIVSNLETLAREAGALTDAESYRNYASAMQNSLSMSGTLLLDRYAEAQSESPVKVVVMNGGGSDVLRRSCGDTPTADCPLMLDIVAGANEVLTQMANDGVEDVVWFYYPDPMDAELLAELDVLRPLLADACANAPLPCHWVDLRPSFDGHYSEYMQSDFVPTAEGAQVAATAIWSTMRRECIAQ